jgi:hypothetical protein
VRMKSRLQQLSVAGAAADDVRRRDSARRRRNSFPHLESLWTFTLRASLEHVGRHASVA